MLAFYLLTVAEWMLATAVAIGAYSRGGALGVGLVGFRFAPAALASLATAHLGDRFGRQRVLVLSAVARTSVATAIAIAIAVGAPFEAVLALVWLDACAGSAYRPAQAGLLPALVVTPGQLTAAAMLSSNAKTSGQVLGALAGALLVATSGTSSAVAVAVAAGLYASAAALATIRTGRPSVASSRHGLGLRELRRLVLVAARALNQDRAARRIAEWSCARSLIRGLWVSLGVVASLTILGMGASGFGLLMAAAGGGIVLSISLTARLAGRRLLAWPFAVGLGLCCLPVAAVGLVSRPVLALGLMLGWGIGMTLSDAAAQALLNRVVAPSALGSVVGLMESAKLLAEGLGSVIAPVLVTLFGIRGALLGAGLAVFGLLVANLRGFLDIDRRAVGQVELLELVQGVPLFSSMRVAALEAVVAPLVMLEVRAGQAVIRQDESGRRWYLVSKGELEIDVDGYVISRAVRGDSFGEPALLRDVPSSATVRAITDVALLALERADFIFAVTGQDEALGETSFWLGAPRTASDALRRQPMLSHLDGRAIDELAVASTTVSLVSGESLFSEGDDDDRYFVILDGEIEIRIGDGLRRVLAPGDGFGEIAVLHRVARTASAVARTQVGIVAVAGDQLREKLPAQEGMLSQFSPRSASPSV